MPLGKAVDDSGIWTPATHMENQDVIPASWLQSSPTWLVWPFEH